MAPALPADFAPIVQRAARSRIIDFLQPDPTWEAEKYFLCSQVAACWPLLLPCFWPHAVIVCTLGGSCCLVGNAAATAGMMKSRAFVLTEREVLIIQKECSSCYCCFTPCSGCTTGEIIETLPLANITDLVFQGKGSNCCVTACITPPTEVLLQTNTGCGVGQGTNKMPLAAMLGANREAIQRFKHAVLDQRDSLTGQVAPTPMALGAPGHMAPAAQRMAQLKELQQQGLITAEEFERKRQAIIEQM